MIHVKAYLHNLIGLTCSGLLGSSEMMLNKGKGGSITEARLGISNNSDNITKEEVPNCHCQTTLLNDNYLPGRSELCVEYATEDLPYRGNPWRLHLIDSPI